MVVDSGCVLFPSMKAKLLAPATVFTKNMMEKKKNIRAELLFPCALHADCTQQQMFFSWYFELESQVTCIFYVDLRVITVAGSLQLPGACSPTFASCAL